MAAESAKNLDLQLGNVARKSVYAVVAKDMSALGMTLP